MLTFSEATLAEISKGDLVEIELEDLRAVGQVTGTNLSRGTISFVPLVRVEPSANGTGSKILGLQQPAPTITTELGKSGIKLFKAVDSEAAITYPLTWERIVKLEPGVEALLKEIQAECPTDGNYLRIWYGYKEHLSELVGWDRKEASHPQLHSSAAYNIVYHKLLDGLRDPIPLGKEAIPASASDE
jgi:hypothetical protein